jgi:hypothetical protein
MRRTTILFAGFAIVTLALESFRNKPVLVPARAPSLCGAVSNKTVIKLMDTTRQIVPLFKGLGDHAMQVTSNSDDAKKFFNQGLNLYYGFNHLEAYRSFKEAARLDPAMAMAYWGQALSLGPNINAAMDPADVSVVFEAITKAGSLKSKSSPLEQALIEALSRRYTEQAPADRSPLDKAYAESMEKVAAAYPADVDVASLCTEALMDVHPWDYWKKDGSPQSWTAKITSMID